MLNNRVCYISSDVCYLRLLLTTWWTRWRRRWRKLRRWKRWKRWKRRWKWGWWWRQFESSSYGMFCGSSSLKGVIHWNKFYIPISWVPKAQRRMAQETHAWQWQSSQYPQSQYPNIYNIIHFVLFSPFVQIPPCGRMDDAIVTVYLYLWSSYSNRRVTNGWGSRIGKYSGLSSQCIWDF